jgi:glycosyltransferase involved in cell wall biosynthesis
MKLTVAICTWNRAEQLAGALASLTKLEVPGSVALTVLVVDNGSRDRTAEVARSFAGELPVKHVIEPSPGLSRARNRALHEVEEVGGDYLLWIDDDVLVEPGWLAAYAGAFERWPDAAVFGGPVRPLLEGTPPEWLVRCLPRVSYAFAARDLGADPGPLGPSIDRLPYGCNFALRVGAIAGMSFREDLGRRQDGPGRGGEEIDFMQRLLARGRAGRWVPGALVQHRVGVERQTRSFLRAYSVSDAIDDELSRADPAPRMRAQLLARWLAAEVRYRVGRLTRDPEVWVGQLLAAGDAWGRLRARSRGRESR